MNTSNAGSLGAMLAPATAEASASPQTSLTTSDNGEFKQLIDQSIGDPSTKIPPESTADVDVVVDVAEPEPVQSDITSSGTFGEFKQLIDQSIGDPSTKIPPEATADVEVVVDAAEPAPVQSEITSAGIFVDEEPNTEFLPTTTRTDSMPVLDLPRPRIPAPTELSDTEKVDLPTIEEIVVLPLPDQIRSLEGVVNTILGNVTATPEQVESDQDKSVTMSESTPASSNESESDPVTKVDPELLIPLAGNGLVLPSLPINPKSPAGEQSAHAGKSVLDDGAASDRTASGGEEASDRADPLPSTTANGLLRSVRREGVSNRRAGPTAPTGDVTTPTGTPPRTGPTDPPAGESAPTRNQASAAETIQSETRRFEPIPGSDARSDTTGSRVRLESLAAARFASAARRRYQQADLESLSTIRGRGNSSRAGGIRAAQRGDTMKNSGQRNQIAESRVQNVPVVGREGAAATVTVGNPAESAHSGDAGHESRSRIGSSLGDAVSMTVGAARAATGAQSTSELQSVSNSAVKTSEQLILHLTREVMQFKSFNAESMAVVLKPDKHTEIFLHLAMRNGGVEVQARFDRGDFASLNSQWSQLQQTMQQQGVKLSALQESFEQQQQENQLGGSEWGHHQNRREQESDSLDETFVESLDEKQIFGSKKEPVVRPNQVRARNARGSLEAWA